MASLLVLSPCRFTPFLPYFTPSRSKIGVLNLSPYSRATTRPLTQLGSSSMNESTAESEPSSQNDTVNAGNSDDALVQYVVLRRDLIDTWPLGSVVTQGCHASVSAIWSHKEDPHTLQYCSPENIDSMHKVTLEVKGETQIRNLSEKLNAGGIIHKLWIEQPENVPTCLATKPVFGSTTAGHDEIADHDNDETKTNKSFAGTKKKRRSSSTS